MAKDEFLKRRAQIAEHAARAAKERARSARWDLDIAVFLFAVLILILILLNYKTLPLWIVSLIGFLGLALVWLVGWRRGRQLYPRFYKEELSKYELGQEIGIKMVEQEQE